MAPAEQAVAKPTTPGRITIFMPDEDSSITEGRILGWLKLVGENVVVGEIVVEVETDKAVISIEAPVAGRLVEIWAAERSAVLPGQALAAIESAQRSGD